MSIATYGELKAALASWSDRSDLAPALDDFVLRAHETITDQVVLFDELTIAGGATSVPGPSGFRMAVELWLAGRPTFPLDTASEGQMATLTGGGAPRCYRVSGSTLHLAPTADESYAARVLYKLARTAFAADADTNAVLTRHPFVYLWGSLAALSDYLRDDAATAKYEVLFRDTIDKINRQEREDAMSGLFLQPHGVTV